MICLPLGCCLVLRPPGIKVGQPVSRVQPPVLWSSPDTSRVEILYEFGVFYVVTALQVTSQITQFRVKALLRFSKCS